MNSLKNQSGKVFTIFLIIIAIVLASLTAISLFFFQKEIDRRKSAETQVHESNQKIIAFEDEIKNLKKQKFLLEEKNKEADEKINGLLDDLDLEKGLREELKIELSSVKEELKKVSDDRAGVKDQLTALQKDTEQKIAALEVKLKAESQRVEALKKENDDLTSSNSQLIEELDEATTQPDMRSSMPNKIMSGSNKSAVNVDDDMIGFDNAANIELDPIVVNPDVNFVEEEIEELNKTIETPSGAIQKKNIEPKEGRILSVDAETEFVILNLGEKQGIKNGQMLSVYRGQEYLGDIKVTRVQPDMAAADFIFPFAPRNVRKNDQVVFKQ